MMVLLSTISITTGQGAMISCSCSRHCNKQVRTARTHTWNGELKKQNRFFFCSETSLVNANVALLCNSVRPMTTIIPFIVPAVRNNCAVSPNCSPVGEMGFVLYTN